MDWTTNPLKGLFFEVNDPRCDNENGVMWALSFASWREDLHEATREYWETELVPFLPEQLNSRLTAQEGCFLSYPLPAHRKPLTTIDELAAGNHAGMAFIKFIVPAIEVRPHHPDLPERSLCLAEVNDNCSHLAGPLRLGGRFDGS